MPICSPSSYKTPLFFANNHLQTIFPSILRKVEGINYERERITLPDTDFIDVDWSRVGAKRLMIVLHGLEGNSERPYIKGMIRAANKGLWDGLAWNFRGCSGESNHLLRSYHSGETGDIGYVLDQVLERNIYDEIVLVGFSLGGNVVLKYLGEKGKAIHPSIKKGVAISVPCDLAAAGVKLSKWQNKLYMRRFMNELKEKVKQKEHLTKNIVDLKEVYRARNFIEFDEAFTAPVHGFGSAEDYWTKCSSRPFIPKIRIPTLLINAEDDSFLSPSCYPYEEAEASDYFFLEVPPHGGHVGFITRDNSGQYWSENRTLEFIA